MFFKHFSFLTLKKRRKSSKRSCCKNDDLCDEMNLDDSARDKFLEPLMRNRHVRATEILLTTWN